VATARGEIEASYFLHVLNSHGLFEDDERLDHIVDFVKSKGRHAVLTAEDVNWCSRSSELVDRALKAKLVVPDFPSFSADMDEIFNKVKLNTGGTNASYIPQLDEDRVDPKLFGVSLCTIDGQRYSRGDTQVPFSVQSCSQIVSYALAQQLHGPKVVHHHVGKEPSGGSYDQLLLDGRDMEVDEANARDLRRQGQHVEAEAMRMRPAIPYNPCINAGGIMCASLVKMDLTQAARFEFVMQTWKDLCGFNPKSRTLTRPSFANSIYLSERDTADRNFCLGYMMREAKAFPEGVDLVQVLESYFMYCSIECNCTTLSVIAGTLANGGTCPVTGKKIFEPEVVRNCLSVMFTCGMSDFSGEFAFTMGFPCKSGVGGGLLIVVPGLFGMCVFSPRLGASGNSVRGVQFCEELSIRFAFHTFDSVTHLGKDKHKKDPRVDETATNISDDFMSLLWAAAAGDTYRARMLVARGLQVNRGDYDDRTAMHLAACNLQLEMLKFLVSAGADWSDKDRFGSTPLNDARMQSGPGQEDVIEYLESLEAGGVKNSLKFGRDGDYDHLHRALERGGNAVTLADVEHSLEANGIQADDERVRLTLAKLSRGALTTEDFTTLAADDLISRAIQGLLVIPDWTDLCRSTKEIFDVTIENKLGNNADYIPTLASVDPDQYSVAICSVDGQRLSIGDSKIPFCVQSCCKPINYAIALQIAEDECGDGDLGRDKVFHHVGREPSGRPFNEVILDRRREDEGRGQPAIPHNPCINAGAIMSCSLIDSHKVAEAGSGSPSHPERIGRVMEYWQRLTGGKPCMFDEETYKSESVTADRNWCLGHMMQEAGSFPWSEGDDSHEQKGTKLAQTLEFYFQCCSIMQDTESMSLVASTLANGGVCPVTGERIFSNSIVRDVLSIMFSCGMYDYSGEFAFTMGLPAKSGVAGTVIVVIPNVCGICTWSPRLDGNGNSVRGVDFCARFADVYQVHIFDKLPGFAENKKDLKFYGGSQIKTFCNKLIEAASNGDVAGCERFYNLGGMPLLTMGDYDNRTVLHLACAQGKVDIVDFLLSKNGLNLAPVDRWGHTPLDDAKENGHDEIVGMLTREFNSAKNKGGVVRRRMSTSPSPRARIMSTEGVTENSNHTPHNPNRGGQYVVGETSSEDSETYGMMDDESIVTPLKELNVV